MREAFDEVCAAALEGCARELLLAGADGGNGGNGGGGADGGEAALSAAALDELGATLAACARSESPRARAAAAAALEHALGAVAALRARLSAVAGERDAALRELEATRDELAEARRYSAVPTSP